MKIFRNSIVLSTIIILTIVGCGPRDVVVEKDGTFSPANADKRKIIVLSEKGEISSTCPKNKLDRIDLNSPIKTDDLVFSGKVTAALEAGNQNCYRIGSEVNLQEGKSGAVRAKLEVTRIEIIPVENLTESHQKAMGMSAEELTSFANDAIEKAKAIYNSYGMVSVTFFKMVKGTNAPIPVLKEILTFDKEGERSSGCPADFTDSTRLIIDSADALKVQNQKITAIMEAGDRNCFRIGSEVDLQTSKSSPVLGRLKIVKSQIAPQELLGASQAEALAIPVQDIQKVAADKIAAVKFETLGLVHLTYFELVGAEKSTDPLPPQIAAGCSIEAMIPQLRLNIESLLLTQLQNKNVGWEAASLIVEYKGLQAVENVVDGPVLLPSFRVEFKTLKSNTLVLMNNDLGAGKEKLFVMGGVIDIRESFDVEGSILGKVCHWASVGAGYSLSETKLYNPSSDYITDLLTGTEFNTFSVRSEVLP
jgi:uncharacterized protein YqfB (UPF0267 family)